MLYFIKYYVNIKHNYSFTYNFQTYLCPLLYCAFSSGTVQCPWDLPLYQQISDQICIYKDDIISYERREHLVSQGQNNGDNLTLFKVYRLVQSKMMFNGTYIVLAN